MYSVSFDYFAINGYDQTALSGVGDAETTVFISDGTTHTQIASSYFDMGADGTTVDMNGNSNQQGTAAFNPYSALSFTATSDSAAIVITVLCNYNDDTSYAQLVMDNVVITSLPAAAVSVPFPEPTSSAPLVVNGDFEDGDMTSGTFSDWTEYGYGTMSDTVYDTRYGQSAALQCQGYNSIGLQQTFPTIQGQVYSASYDYFVINGFSGGDDLGDSQAQVNVFDATTGDFFSATYTYIGAGYDTTDGNGYSNQQGATEFNHLDLNSFTAPSDSTTIQISVNCGFDDSTSYATLVVDNVVVQASSS